MVKSEKLGKLMLTVGFMLAVLLLAGFMLCATASADELEPVQETTPVEETVAELADVPIAAVVDELADVPAAAVDELADIPEAVSADESAFVCTVTRCSLPTRPLPLRLTCPLPTRFSTVPPLLRNIWRLKTLLTSQAVPPTARY